MEKQPNKKPKDNFGLILGSVLGGVVVIVVIVVVLVLFVGGSSNTSSIPPKPPTYTIAESRTAKYDRGNGFLAELSKSEIKPGKPNSVLNSFALKYYPATEDEPVAKYDYGIKYYTRFPQFGKSKEEKTNEVDAGKGGIEALANFKDDNAIDCGEGKSLYLLKFTAPNGNNKFQAIYNCIDTPECTTDCETIEFPKDKVECGPVPVELEYLDRVFTVCPEGKFLKSWQYIHTPGKRLDKDPGLEQVKFTCCAPDSGIFTKKK